MSAEHIKLIRMIHQVILGYDWDFYFRDPLCCIGLVYAIRNQNLKTSCNFNPVVFLNK